MKVVDKLVIERIPGSSSSSSIGNLKILEEICTEDSTVFEDKEPKKTPDFSILSLPQEDIRAIQQEYTELSDIQRELFNKNYRKYNLQQFIGNLKAISFAFSPFFEMSKKKGRGRGEFIPLLAIASSKSGGTEDKDIIIGSDIVEVKELDRSRKFLTGKSGSIRKSNLSRSIETFCKYLGNLQINPGTNPLVDKVLNYYEQEYVSSNVSETFIQNIIKVARELETLHTSYIKEDVEYIKIGDKRFEIPQKKERYLPGDQITIGKEIKTVDISLQKLRKHEITNNPEILYTYFDEIVDKYLSEIGYFCLYSVEGVSSIQVYTNVELKTMLRTNYISIVQGNIRLQIRKQ